MFDGKVVVSASEITTHTLLLLQRDGAMAMQIEFKTEISFEREEDLHFNYRVVFDPEENTYTIREVFYENDEIVFWSEEATFPIGENLEDLSLDLELMQEALELPVLVSKDEELVPLVGEADESGDDEEEDEDDLV
jgi:hypothetical protein